VPYLQLTKQKRYQNTFSETSGKKISIPGLRIGSKAEEFWGQINLITSFEKSLIIKLSLRVKRNHLLLLPFKGDRHPEARGLVITIRFFKTFSIVQF
jgi:hypothetical protein